jgi:hypothetical protein
VGRLIPGARPGYRVDDATYRLYRIDCRFLARTRRPTWGVCAPGPIFRGLWVTSPKRPPVSGERVSPRPS